MPAKSGAHGINKSKEVLSCMCRGRSFVFGKGRAARSEPLRVGAWFGRASVRFGLVVGKVWRGFVEKLQRFGMVMEEVRRGFYEEVGWFGSWWLGGLVIEVGRFGDLGIGDVEVKIRHSFLVCRCGVD